MSRLSSTVGSEPLAHLSHCFTGPSPPPFPLSSPSLVLSPGNILQGVLWFNIVPHTNANLCNKESDLLK
jgi:hypothetical protein